ncbi:Z1 domain-containing protein, partial [Lysobacter sp. D1-1-M9]|uniref:Z1 domain-containing protein n=1 Tax=Novilysobacter longmucuonensis TaxID=3098603 RepID=UPI002FCB98BA
MIRIIEDDLDFYRPARAQDREDFAPAMGPDLRDAVLWFLVTCAVRRARGQHDKHMTMLVHTSANITPHQRTADLISGWIASHGDDLRKGIGPSHGRMLQLITREA